MSDITFSTMQKHFDASAVNKFLKSTKGEIDYNAQYLLLPRCFQLNLIIILSFIVIFHIFTLMFSESPAADMLHVEIG